MSDFRMCCLHLGMVETNCYLVWNDETREAFVIDPADQAEAIAMKIKEMNVELTAILLTHGHFDHMMAVPDLKRMFGVPVYAAERERLLLQDSMANLSGAWVGRPLALEADYYVEEEEELEVAGFTITVMETPGHTSGSVCYYLKDEKILFSGDTLFCCSYGRTDLETGSTQMLMSSLREKVLVLPPETRVYPGHSSSTSIEYERRCNPAAAGMRF